MFNSKKHLSRRTMLRGAGIALGLPLLDAMIPASTALAQTAAAAPTRLGFVYFPHGAVMQAWVPKERGANFTFSPILEPLNNLRDYVTVVSGLRNKGGESTNPHGIIEETWLSCVNPNDRDRGLKGVTADQLAARHIGQDTPLPSLELCGEPGGAVSYRTPQQPLPMEGNPRRVFYTMFGQGDTYDERIAILQQSNSLLDYVKDATASLNRKLDAADRVRVSDYLDSVREIERRIQKLEVGARGLEALPEAPIGPPDDFGALLDLQFEMMALAWQTNQTRIASMRMVKEASMRVYPAVGVDEAFHPLSHHQNDPGKFERLIRIQRYHTERFATFVERLAQIPDGNGSLLDHSIILFGSNMSNSDVHNNDPLPQVLLGKGGGIKGGQHLAYPQDTPHASLLHTMLEKAGVQVDAFADSTGPFAEV
ncbi:MAG: DUF1552 domain-containing protein [Pseudomonadales bacterium]|jgi:hypothetical protein|nr:DUF1552 domain-containing protein [Pseudomonadales bacterium]